MIDADRDDKIIGRHLANTKQIITIMDPAVQVGVQLYLRRLL